MRNRIFFLSSLFTLAVLIHPAPAPGQDVFIDIGTLPPGKTVSIQFDAVIGNPLPAGVSQVSNQGVVSASNAADAVTDDPDTGAPGDATVTPLQTDTAVSISQSAPSSAFGQSVTFTAAVSVVPPALGTADGTVTFKDGSAVLGTAALDSIGGATLEISSLATGSRTISAEYAGSGDLKPATDSLTHTVNKADTETALSASPNPSLPGQNVTFSVVVSASPPGSATPSGTVSFLDGATPIGTDALAGGLASISTASLSGGTHAITAQYAGDANFNPSSDSRIQSVNSPPSAVDDATFTLSNTAISVQVLTNDSDADNDPLIVSNVTNGASGAALIDSGSQSVTYTPNALFSGADAFQYAVSDGVNPPVTATVTVTVINQAPAAVDDATSTLSNTPIEILVLTNDTDPENDALKVVGVTPTSSGGTAVITPTATNGLSITYTPASLFSGTDTFQYIVSDGTLTSLLADVTVTVINQPPSAVPDTESTPSNTPVIVSVLLNDTDPENDALSVVNVTPGANGQTAVNAGAIGVTYTPDPLFSGPDAFEYAVSDGNNPPVTATVSIAVQNQPPVAVNDATSTLSNTPAVFAVLSNDSDPENEPLAIVNVTAGALGSAAIDSGSQTVTYTPNSFAFGVDSFEYAVSDGVNAPATATVQVTVVNQPPDAVDDAESTLEDTPVTIVVLANDSDPENEPLTVTAATDGLNGDASTNGTTVTYTPDPDFWGTDRITYTVSDGQGQTDTANVDLTVTNVDDDPVARPFNVFVSRGTDVPLRLQGSDPDGDPLTYEILERPSIGTVSGFDPVTGDFVYTSPPDAQGDDALTYRVEAGGAQSAPGRVTIVLAGSNQPPEALPQSVETKINTPVKIVLTGSDPEGNQLIFKLERPPLHGRLSKLDLTEGMVKYVPNENFAGTDFFTFRANDMAADSPNAATVTIAVTGVPPATPAPSPTPEPELTPTPTETPGGPTATPTAAEGTPTSTPTATATGLPEPSGTPAEATPTATPEAQASPTPTPTVTPTPTPGEPPVFPAVDEIVIAQGGGGRGLVNIRNFDPNADAPKNAVIDSYRALSDTMISFIGGGTGRAVYTAVGDADNDGDPDLVDSFGPVTDGALFPNVIIPRDASTKLPIGHSFAAFPAGSGNPVRYDGGEIRTAVGDFKEDGTNLIAAAQGFGSENGLVRLFEHVPDAFPAWAIVGQFQPLDNVPTANNANGGATLAAGDLDGDGRDELLAGQTPSDTSLTQFTVLDIDATGNLPIRRNFTAFPAGFRGTGGVELAVLDLDGDGQNEIAAAGMGTGATGEPGSILGIIRPLVVNGSIIGFVRPANFLLKVVGDDAINPGGGLSLGKGNFDGDPSNGEEIVYGSGPGAPQSFYRVVKIQYDPGDDGVGALTGFNFLIGPPRNVNFIQEAYVGENEPLSGAVNVSAGELAGG